MKNKTLYFLCDSRYFLEELKKISKKFLIFFFLGILLLIYQQRSSLINIIIALFSYLLLLLIVVIRYNRCEKYEYIIEELFIKEDKIIIFHVNKKKRIEKYRIEFDEIVDLEYKDVFFLNPYNQVIFFHKHIEKCRLLKIKLKSKKVVSFGYFLEEKEGRKIIKAIKESKENYEKIQKEIKEFQENKKNSELLYNKALEERYQEILKKIIKEEKFYIFKINERIIINGDSTAIQNLEIFKNMEWEEVNFYIFYVNFLSKKENADKVVEVAYNGTDSKKVKVSELREDINRIRYPEILNQEEKIEDNLKNLQKLYDKEEKKINDMGEFIRLSNQLKEDIENLGEAYEK